MQKYIDRLLRCGWRLDNACLFVSDMYREQNFSGLEEFVRREEAQYVASVSQ